MKNRLKLWGIIAATAISLLSFEQVAHAISVPSFPVTQELHAFGYYKEADTSWATSPHYGQVPAIINPANGLATVTPTNLAELNSPNGSEVTNAGKDFVTGVTWVLFRDCKLWGVSASGSVTAYDLTAKLSAVSATDCLSLMIRGDSTAVIFGIVDLGSGANGSVFEINLADGSLVSGSVKTVSQYLGGMAKNPNTNQIWVSVVWAANSSDNGIYKYDMSTGLDMSSQIQVGDLWGLAFDSSGTLWGTDWATRQGFDCATYSCLSYLNPGDATPANTFGTVGEMKDSSGKYFVTSGIWTATAVQNSGSGSNAQPVISEPELANTGFSELSTSTVGFGMVLLLSGLLLSILATARSRKAASKLD